MGCAAITYVFNEAINLPIWLNYYGKLFGFENLYVVDRCSDDGSTLNLGSVNVIKVPRRPFDEHEKTAFLSSFHASLTSFYDAVIASDCDEIIVPDPSKFTDLNDYIAGMKYECVNAVGIDIIHMITEELPIDLSKPILSQRRFGLFSSPECKPLLSKVALKWLPGLHTTNKQTRYDQDLFIFHLKLLDYSVSVNRQRINLETKWSEDSLSKNYGAHHRYGLSQFVKQNFLVPLDLLNQGKISIFNFEEEIRVMLERTIIDHEGYFRPPMDIPKRLVELPKRFLNIL